MSEYSILLTRFHSFQFCIYYLFILFYLKIYYPRKIRSQLVWITKGSDRGRGVQCTWRLHLGHLFLLYISPFSKAIGIHSGVNFVFMHMKHNILFTCTTKMPLTFCFVQVNKRLFFSQATRPTYEHFLLMVFSKILFNGNWHKLLLERFEPEMRRGFDINKRWQIKYSVPKDHKRWKRTKLIIFDENLKPSKIIPVLLWWIKITGLGKQEPQPAGTTKWATTSRFEKILGTTSVVRSTQNPQNIVRSKIHWPWFLTSCFHIWSP